MARKDDLETWLYIIMKKMTGRLPWNDKERPKNDKAKVLQMKGKSSDSV